jgi:protein-arginine kinase
MDIGDIMTELKILYKDQLGYPLTTCALSCGTANRNGGGDFSGRFILKLPNILPLIGLRK